MSFKTQDTINLQATLSSSSAMSGPDVEIIRPHHPITCVGELRYDDEGCLACEHVQVAADDRRTRACLDHSMALLLIELARSL